MKKFLELLLKMFLTFFATNVSPAFSQEDIHMLTKRWEAPFSSTLYNVKVAANGQFFIACTKDHLLCIAEGNGQVLWKYSAPSPTAIIDENSNEILMWSRDKNEILAFSLEGVVKRRIACNAKISLLSDAISKSADGYIVCSAEDGRAIVRIQEGHATPETLATDLDVSEMLGRKNVPRLEILFVDDDSCVFSAHHSVFRIDLREKQPSVVKLGFDLVPTLGWQREIPGRAFYSVRIFPDHKLELAEISEASDISAKLNLSGINLFKFAIFPQENMLVTSTSGAIKQPNSLNVINLVDGELLESIAWSNQPASAIIRVPSKQSLISINIDGLITCWDLASTPKK